MTAIYAIFLFALLIFPHELGHFLVAKAAGVQVNEFAFGMGPALIQRKRGETTYSIRLIPLGGYCAMEGEDEETDSDRGFNHKPVWVKLAVLVAGSATNVIIAILTLAIFAGVTGMVTTELGEVQADSPAFEAGLAAGDKICAVDGEQIKGWNQLASVLGESSDSRIVEIERDGQPMTVKITPVYDEETERYLIGIMPYVSHSPVLAVKAGAVTSWKMTASMLTTLKELVTGKVKANQLAGPVGIVSMAGETKRYGITYFVNLLALMSLNLAIVNMLPIPALDGGRILLVLIRKVTGKMISDQVEGWIHTLGMVLLFGLMIFVTVNDLVRLVR